MTEILANLQKLDYYLNLIKNDIVNTYHLFIYANAKNYFIVVCRYSKKLNNFVGGVNIAKEDYKANKHLIDKLNCYVTFY